MYRGIQFFLFMSQNIDCGMRFKRVGIQIFLFMFQNIDCGMRFNHVHTVTVFSKNIKNTIFFSPTKFSFLHLKKIFVKCIYNGKIVSTYCLENVDNSTSKKSVKLSHSFRFLVYSEISVYDASPTN